MHSLVNLLHAGLLAVALPALGCVSSAHAQEPSQPHPHPAAVESSAPAVHEARTAVSHARAQERAHLQQQRQAIGAGLKQAEMACYQRFAVEDCLKRERRSAREAIAPLAQREAALDEAERRERAALRLNDIAKRQQTAPAAPGPATVRSPATPPDVLQQERAFEAQERAQRLQEKQQRHAAEQAEQGPQREAAAAKARQRLDEKREAAERRRARALQAQQERAAAGRKAPAPLDSLP